MKHPLGKGLFKDRQLEMYAAPPPIPDFDEGDKTSSPAEKGEGAEPKGAEPSAGAAAPSLSLDAIQAVDFVKACEDPAIVLACYEQDKRVTVRAACEKRAEELATAEAAA